MDIVFKSNKLRRVCNDSRLLAKKHGGLRARKIITRLGQLRAAATLEDIARIGRCHELKGNRAGQLALDIGGGWRLVIEPANNPIPQREDGGLIWGKVTIVAIIEITDYHS